MRTKPLLAASTTRAAAAYSGDLTPVAWEEKRGIPRSVRAVLGALRSTGARTDDLRALTDREWQEALSFCDRHQLTLHLGSRCGEALPAHVQSRIRRNLRDNTERHARLWKDQREICDALEEADAAYVVLKGFAQWPRYVADTRLRAQYDVDLYCPPESIYRARDILLELHYVPARGFEDLPIDHLPAMIRSTRYELNGNYFDPEMPFCVDLHFRLWDEETERFAAPGVEDFWSRRSWQQVEERRLPVLCPADALAYGALHLLRHLLRGSLRICHAYEVAYFLDNHLEDEEFWRTWRELHPPGLRRLEAIVLRLAAVWLACPVPETVGQEIDALPAEIQAWFMVRAVCCLADRGAVPPEQRRTLAASLPAGRVRQRAQSADAPAASHAPSRAGGPLHRPRVGAYAAHAAKSAGEVRRPCCSARGSSRDHARSRSLARLLVVARRARAGRCVLEVSGDRLGLQFRPLRFFSAVQPVSAGRWLPGGLPRTRDE
jgi:hypothetical protein